MTTVSLRPTLADPSRTAPSGRVAVAYAAVGLTAVGVYFGVSATAQAVLYGLLGLSAVGAIYLGAVRPRRTGWRAWQCFALGFLCEVAGDTISSVYELGLGHEPPVPSAADVFYLAGYPLLVLGIVLMVRARGARTTTPTVLDALIVFVAIATVQWIFFLPPLDKFAGDADAQIVSLSYPTMDVLMLVGFGHLLVGGGRRSLSYRLLLSSVALWIAGDEIYALTVGSYSAGSWLDAFWLVSYVAWGAAALVATDADGQIRDRRAVPRLTGSRLGLLAAALLAVPAALVVEVLTGHEQDPLAAAIGGAVIAVLVLLRLAGLVRVVERARLDERRARWEAEVAGRQVEQQNDELRELDRLKDEFVSSVSHELRTPLTSIAGYVELLLEEEEDADVRRHLEVVERNSNRLLGLVSDLLFTARLQGGRLELRSEPVDLRPVVEHAAVSAEPPARAAGVTLHIRADAVPVVRGERDRLAQLVDNLVSNAIKFTRRGGNVVVSLAAHDGVVQLEVVDDGIGLTDEDCANLFERFFRAPSALERQVPGTGLGLYISKAIVDAHDGRIAVRRRERGGTSFLVELPVA